jgi:hypothetical protein
MLTSEKTISTGAQQRASLFGIRRFQHAIAAIAQVIGRGHAGQDLILHHQDDGERPRAILQARGTAAPGAFAR